MMNVFDFEKEYRRLYLPLGMFALRIVEDVECSEDIVQECFSKVWKAIKEGRKINDFKAFMYQAVRNEALLSLRKRFPEQSIDDLDITVDAESEDTSLRDARLWRAIDKLPPKCREVFLMGQRDDMTYAQIAEKQGISTKTVENQMSKALRMIRESANTIYRMLFCA